MSPAVSSVLAFFSSLGFEVLLLEAQVALVKPGYIKQLAQRQGPYPRRQDLRLDGLHVGVRPPGRIFSVSYGWASEYHPSPSGVKLQELAEALERFGADDEQDGVFMGAHRQTRPVPSPVQPR